MSDNDKIGFQLELIKIPIEKILPRKNITSKIKKTSKFKQIEKSIHQVGVIENIVVYKKDGIFLLIDGHLRYEVLKGMGETEIECILTKDDEAFTYNHKVNRLTPIQENFMILEAAKKGVSEKKIAKALNINLKKIREKMNLLNGICDEALNLLKNKKISAGAIRIMKKMEPYRQVEVSELMVATNNYTLSYAKALFIATPNDQLIDKKQQIEGISPEQIAQMEIETKRVENDLNLAKDSYGQNCLNLVQARAYLNKLLNNAKTVRYLSKHYPDYLSGFQKIIEATSLEY